MQLEDSSSRGKSAVALLTVLAATLRLFRLDHQSVWLDEGYQYHFASAPTFREVLARVLDPAQSTHPPLSHLINHVFLELGDTDFMLRLPSALFGIASIPLLYLLAKRLAGERAALFATALMAISPFHLWFSQEARMYAQLVFFVLLSSLALFEAVDRGRAGWWILYTLAAIGGMYTHVYMAFTLTAHGLWVLAFERRGVVPIVLAGVVVAIAFSPMISFFLGAQAEASSEVPVGSVQFSWAALPYTLFTFAGGFSLGPSVRELKTASASIALRNHVVVIAVAGIAFAAAAAAALPAMWSERRRELVFCLLALVLPLVGPIAMSLLPWMIFNVRYTSGAFPFFCVLTGAGVAYLLTRVRPVGWLVGGTIALLSLISVNNHYSDSRYMKEDIRGAVAAWRHDGGTSYLASNLTPPVQRYLTAEELPRYVEVRDTKQIVPVLQRALTEHAPEQLWVIVSRDFDGTQQTAVRRALRVEEERALPGVVLFRLSGTLDVKALDESGLPGLERFFLPPKPPAQ
jgi:uncharacterized membrane protein